MADGAPSSQAPSPSGVEAALAEPPAGPGTPLVVLRQVTKRFGVVAALQRLELDLHDGCHLLLAGANGAGKTTLLRLMAGLTRPHRGEVLIGGADPRRQASARRQIGLLSHQPLFYDDLTCAENLQFFARLYDLVPDADRIPAALERVGLADRRDLGAGSLSRGMKQRLALARATLHRPRLLLLDEPFTGLDRASAADLASYLTARSAREGTASVLVTHRVAEVAPLVNRVLVLDRGRVCADRPWSGDDGNALQAICEAAPRETTREGGA